MNRNLPRVATEDLSLTIGPARARLWLPELVLGERVQSLQRMSLAVLRAQPQKLQTQQPLMLGDRRCSSFASGRT